MNLFSPLIPLLAWWGTTLLHNGAAGGGEAGRWAPWGEQWERGYLPILILINYKHT